MALTLTTALMHPMALTLTPSLMQLMALTLTTMLQIPTVPRPARVPSLTTVQPLLARLPLPLRQP
jgi:hypothetical protein